MKSKSRSPVHKVVLSTGVGTALLLPFISFFPQAVSANDFDYQYVWGISNQTELCYDVDCSQCTPIACICCDE